MTLLAILMGTLAAGLGSVLLAALLANALLSRYTQHLLSLAAGALLGPEGAAAGAFGGTYLVEFGGSIDEQFAAMGIDQTDPAAMAKVYRDPEFFAWIEANVGARWRLAFN